MNKLLDEEHILDGTRLWNGWWWMQSWCIAMVMM